MTGATVDMAAYRAEVESSVAASASRLHYT
jgi:hypothetical protein